MTMGQNLFYEGDREKGIQNVTEAIDLMAKTDRENTDHLIHGYLNMLASMYGETKDYDNALKTNERNLQLTMEGTRWGAAPNQQLIDRRMAKEDELKGLKSELAALDRKIQLALAKDNEPQQQQAVANGDEVVEVSPHKESQGRGLHP